MNQEQHSDNDHSISAVVKSNLQLKKFNCAAVVHYFPTEVGENHPGNVAFFQKFWRMKELNNFGGVVANSGEK